MVDQQHKINAAGDAGHGSFEYFSGEVAQLRHRPSKAIGELYARVEVSTTPMPNNEHAGEALPRYEDAVADITTMRASLGLQKIRRYLDQWHWGKESAVAHTADEIEPDLKLENVAAHSWHVSDVALLLAPHFPHLRLDQALQLAILHDKLELITGDFDPVGTDGQGSDSHAFNAAAEDSKTRAELVALDEYIASLRESIRAGQRALMLEVIYRTSEEARFVMAVDKLQALTYVLEKKHGAMTDDHLVFSLRYSAKSVEYFPNLEVHFGILVRLLIERVAEYRGTTWKIVMMRLPVSIRELIQRYIR